MAFFRIKEAAEKVGVLPHVLRFWESQFPSLKPPKTTRGQRLYSDEDIEALLKIKYLLYTEGYSISGAKKYLKEHRIVSGVPQAAAHTQDQSARAAGEMRSEDSGWEWTLEREFLKEIHRELSELVGITREI